MTDGADLVDRARRLALTAHGDQRYGQEPYEVHLRHVDEVVQRYPHTPVLRAAAWLHDAVEDTDLTEAAVAEEVGPDVAAIVAAVTDEPGKNRAERKRRTLVKLAAATADARAVKLADRIANLESSLAGGRRDLHAMYTAEHPEFRRQLHRPGEHDPQWARLDELINASPG